LFSARIFPLPPPPPPPLHSSPLPPSLIHTRTHTHIGYGLAKAECDLALTLKNAVMEAILRQDIGAYLAVVVVGLDSIFCERVSSVHDASFRCCVLCCLFLFFLLKKEYFDKHKVGVLQERLNADTQELSGNALSVPASIIQNATFVLTNTYILWQKSHALTLIGSAILPLVALGQYYLVEYYRTLARKQSKYREMSSASTTETLSEIRTVREHAMEPQGRLVCLLIGPFISDFGFGPVLFLFYPTTTRGQEIRADLRLSKPSCAAGQQLSEDRRLGVLVFLRLEPRAGLVRGWLHGVGRVSGCSRAERPRFAH
jgi:hypothetical protein